MLATSWMWSERIPSTTPLLLPTNNLIVARTHVDVPQNGDHWSGNGTILVSSDAVCRLQHNTAMSQSVSSDMESIEATRRSVIEMSPSFCFLLTEVLARLCNVCVGIGFG